MDVMNCRVSNYIAVVPCSMLVICYSNLEVATLKPHAGPDAGYGQACVFPRRQIT